MGSSMHSYDFPDPGWQRQVSREHPYIIGEVTTIERKTGLRNRFFEC